MSTTAKPKKLCFVIGQIGHDDSEARIHADWLLKGIIEPVMTRFPDFLVERADKLPEPGVITTQIISRLHSAELVIADLSGLNPNVFYEIGIRHMVQKPIVHMQLSTEKPPFDVSGFRLVMFSRVRFDDVTDAKDELYKQIEAVLSADYVVENPVTHALGRLKLEQSATPEEKVLLGEMQEVKQRLKALEAQMQASVSFIPTSGGVHVSGTVGTGRSSAWRLLEATGGTVTKGSGDPEGGVGQ